MNVKISEKDKMLLVVLAIIVVVFAAVMLPKFGIKALLEQKSEIVSDTNELAAANEIKLAELITNGIPAHHAQTYWNAKDAIEKNILYKKHEAMKIANTIYISSDPNVSFAVPEWLEDVDYFKYEINEENRFAEIRYNVQEFNRDAFIEFEKLVLNADEEWEEDVEKVPVMMAVFSIDVNDYGNNSFGYPTEMKSLESELIVFPRLLLFLSQLEQKGSIRIDSYSYTTNDFPVVTFTVYMPLVGEMDKYSASIAECPNCNAPYYIEDALDGDYVCKECNNPIEPLP